VPKAIAEKDRHLVRRVEAADVHGRIGFGVAQALRLGEHVLERPARRSISVRM
jgi:hypothetical protein